MFYARINRIREFNNRESFPGLFNSAEMRICGFDAGGRLGNNAGTQNIASLPGDPVGCRQTMLNRTEALPAQPARPSGYGGHDGEYTGGLYAT